MQLFGKAAKTGIAGVRRNLLIGFICIPRYRIVRAGLSPTIGCPMRELFDEVAGHSPLDPEEAVRRATRVPQRKRFYKEAGIAAAGGGFAVTLDGKDVAKYLGSDLLFYRAGHPEALVAREAAHWDPVLTWAADELGAHFILSEGIVYVTQPEQAIKAARGVFPADPWPVAALHVVTTVTGSALLALALFCGAMDSDDVWAAAHVDDDWNVEKWGVDEEVAARRAARFIDFRAAVTVLDALRA
jgi:chaperone required for assembly of F1-ATPase